MSGRRHHWSPLEQPARKTARTAPNGAHVSGSGPASFDKEHDMMFPGWLRPHRVLMAIVAAATGALACKDTTTPREFSTAGITEPRLTLGVGFALTPVGRGNLGKFHIKSKDEGYKVELKSQDDTDIVVANIVQAPGGTSGWHSHPGPAMVVVKTGALTVYHGNDRRCSPMRHPAGTVFVEKGGMVHVARNEGDVEATAVATFFVPAGAQPRIDEAAPGNCPF